MQELPFDIWMVIFTYKAEREKRAARLIAERIENYIYYHIYKSTFCFEITRRLYTIRSTEYVDFLLEKAGIRYEFKHMNYHWAEELNKADGYVDTILQEIERDILNNNLWDTYLPVTTTAMMIGGDL